MVSVQDMPQTGSLSFQCVEDAGSRKPNFFCGDCRKGFRTRVKMKEHTQRPCMRSSVRAESRQEIINDPPDENEKRGVNIEVKATEVPHSPVIDVLNPSEPWKVDQSLLPSSDSEDDHFMTELLENDVSTSSEGSDENYQCPVCKMDFESRSSLVAHLEQYKGEKVYPCLSCDNVFTRASVLKDHLAAHEGVRTHQCCFCTYSYSQISEIQKHLMVHDGETAHACWVCFMVFSKTRSFELHMSTHVKERPHKREVCSMTLSGHEITHVEEGSYRCVFCSKTFKKPSNLNRHMIFHPGYRPYKCDTCSITFRTHESFRRHEMAHNPAPRLSSLN